jgi:hypothetical protein
VPDLQRWLNRDPLEEHGDRNLFRFVFNDPNSVVDPDGELALLGAALGFGLNLASQLIANGGNLSQVSVTQLAIATVQGAIGAGVASQIAKLGATVAQQALVNGVAGGTLNGLGTIANNLLSNKDPLDNVPTAIIFGCAAGATGTIVGAACTPKLPPDPTGSLGTMLGITGAATGPPSFTALGGTTGDLLSNLISNWPTPE